MIPRVVEGHRIIWQDIPKKPVMIAPADAITTVDVRTGDDMSRKSEQTAGRTGHNAVLSAVDSRSIDCDSDLRRRCDSSLVNFKACPNIFPAKHRSLSGLYCLNVSHSVKVRST